MPSNQNPSPPLSNGPAAVPTLRSLGTSATTAAAGNDSRFPSAPIGVAGAVSVEDGLGGRVERKLTLDDLGPAYTINSFSCTTNVVEIGTTVANPAFTASYSSAATSITIYDGTHTDSVALPGTSFAYNAGGIPARSYSNNGLNATQGFTLSATNGVTKTANATITWEPRLYYGVSTDPGTYNSAFVTGLATNLLAPARQGLYSMTASTGQYFFFAFPTPYGGTSANFFDNATGFNASVSIVGTVNITAATAGTPVTNYTIFRSDNASLGAQTIRVS